MQACAFFLVVLLVLVALLTEAVNSLLICTNLSNRILITMRHKYAKFGYFFGFVKRHQKQRWSKPIFNCKMDFNEDDIIIPPNIDSEFLPKNVYRSIQIHSRWEHQQQRRWFLTRLLFIRSLFIPQRESLFFFRQAMDNNLSDISSGSSLIDCLLDDLPAMPSNCIRLFLARHGQTESNRLHLVQGSRVDTSLTDTGKKQAQRIGQVLRRQFRNKNACFVHSKWIRSKETAALAALEMVQHSNNDSNSTIVIQKDPVSGSPPSLLLLPSISKIDFGLQEGNSTKDILSEMFQIYNSWSAGFIDVRPVGGGESGREVLERIANSFHSFVHLTTTKIGNNHQPYHAVVAVSHSSFLRMMLATALNIPLLQAFTTMPQMNGCINVLDISTTENITMVATNCNLFSPRWDRPSSVRCDFSIVLPKIRVIRINEISHLEGLL